MPRHGLNCTLSYTTRKGKQFGYRVRVRRLVKGYTMLAEESQARTSRAFYPRRTAPSEFSIEIDLIGRWERISFNRYLMEYASQVLEEVGTGEESIQMKVVIPSRNFIRLGIPKEGVEFGTRLGEMVFSPRLVFETSREPLDWNADFDPSIVQADAAGMKSDATKYFYPTGTQLSGEDEATAILQVVNSVPSGDPGEFNDPRVPDAGV